MRQLTPRQERFAQLVAAGMLPTHAFRQIAGQNRAGDSVQANRMLRIVKPRVAELAADAATQAVLTVAEKRGFLARVVRTAPGMIDETSPLCQGVKVGADGAKQITMPNKLQALELDAKLSGELTPRLDVSGTVLHVLTADERTRRLQAIMERRAKARVIEGQDAAQMLHDAP